MQTAVVEDVCAALGQAIQDQALEVTSWDGVDFHPEGVGWRTDGEGRFLEGEMVLDVSHASDLMPLSYRVGSTGLVEAGWNGSPRDEPADERSNALVRYPFRIKVRGTEAATVQILVRQDDEPVTSRTFTYSTPAVQEGRWP